MEKAEYDALVKRLYMPPKGKPQIVEIPPLAYAMIDGEGDPNTDARFTEAVGALYAVSYGLKMLPKKGAAPKGYFEYKVSALEGLWDVKDGQAFDVLKKDKLRWTLMIMQPPFLTQALFEDVREMQKKKKGSVMDAVRLETFCEGLCCQMLHTGPFDNEPATFEKMHAFIEQQGCERAEKSHHEIYLSDFRRTAPEKLKTILRFRVRKRQ